MTIIEVSVSVDCAECESRIRKNLLKLRGVDDVEIDKINQKVKVLGSIDQKKVLKAVRRSGKRAVICEYPYTYSSVYQPYHPEYYYQYEAFNSKPNSYNYHVHGYDSYDLHGNYYVAASTYSVGHRASFLFSDENPKACSIM